MKNLLAWLQLARIDFKNRGQGNSVKVRVLEGEHSRVVFSPSLSQEGECYSLVAKDKHLLLEVECRGAGELIIRLLGVYRPVPGGKRLPLLVDYTRLAVDEEVIFWELKTQWHDRPYAYRKQVSDGEKLKVEISWSDHAYRREELARLLSLWETLPGI